MLGTIKKIFEKFNFSNGLKGRKWFCILCKNSLAPLCTCLKNQACFMNHLEERMLPWAPGSQQSAASSYSALFKGNRVCSEDLRRLGGKKTENINHVTPEGQFPIPKSDLERQFKTPVRDAWLISAEEFIFLAVNCTLGISLLLSMALEHAVGVAHSRAKLTGVLLFLCSRLLSCNITFLSKARRKGVRKSK